MCIRDSVSNYRECISDKEGVCTEICIRDVKGVFQSDQSDVILCSVISDYDRYACGASLDNASFSCATFFAGGSGSGDWTDSCLLYTSFIKTSSGNAFRTCTDHRRDLGRGSSRKIK